MQQLQGKQLVLAGKHCTKTVNSFIVVELISGMSTCFVEMNVVICTASCAITFHMAFLH